MDYMKIMKELIDCIKLLREKHSQESLLLKIKYHYQKVKINFLLVKEIKNGRMLMMNSELEHLENMILPLQNLVTI
jgi:hypothetical protein